MKRLSERISLTSLMAALAVLCEVLPLDVPFPLMTRLTFDPTGIPLAFLVLACGFKEGAIATLITALVISIPRPPFKPPNPFGALMKGLAELSTLVGIYIAISASKKDMKRTLAYAMLSGGMVRVIVMSIANFFLLPLFFRISQSVVLSLLIPIAVFNIIQGVLNIVGASFLYKIY